jgi:hypothetical protein
MAKSPRRAATQTALETAERLLRSLRGADEDIAAEAARLAELSRMRRMREPEGTAPYELALGAQRLPGAPRPPDIPGVGIVSLGPNPEVLAAARAYSERSGIPLRKVLRFPAFNPERAARIAREYDVMAHTPTDPDTARSYRALIDETTGQYESLLSAGFKPYFIGPQDPYAKSPYLALADMAVNKRLGVFPTRSGYGSNEDFDVALNPMLEQTPFTLDGEPMLANDLFRAVHDVFGHGPSGAGFRGSGEEMAFQTHAGMYSPVARRAAASELRGQNSWLNYGPYGERNRTASIEDTIFADQKTGLMPRWASEEGLEINQDRVKRFMDEVRRGDTPVQGAVDPETGVVTLVHYAPRELSRIDPEMFGTGLSKRTTREFNRLSSADAPKRSYYGIESLNNPYQREPGLGPIKHEVQIQGELLYPMGKDPDGLRKLMTGMSKEERMTSLERLIADKGYSGYIADDPVLGAVAAIFDPLDVRRVIQGKAEGGEVTSEIRKILVPLVVANLETAA